MKLIELREFCKENILDEKIFIVPTRTIGMQIVNKMARDGYPSINLRTVTLKGLAFEMCEEYIANNNKLIIDDILGNNLIIGILKDLSKLDSDSFFFRSNLIDSKTAEEVYKVIMELKYSGLEHFPEVKNLDKIYMEYKARLKKLNAVDYCDIIIEASNSSNINLYREKKIAIASNIEFNNAEEILFKKFKNCTRIKMPVKSVEGRPKNYYYKENSGKTEFENKNIKFYEGYGTKEEIGIILEDIKRKIIPLDEVVIAYTNSKYVNLINIELDIHGIPGNFGGGLDIEFSSVYRFINTIFTWAVNYYNVKEIKPIFINDDIKIDKFSAPEMYEELVECKIVSLKKNYDRVLKLEDDTNIAIERDKNLNKFQAEKRIWLREFFRGIFEAIPRDDYIRFDQCIPKFMSLITRYVKNVNKYDGAAKQVVLEILDKIGDINMEVSRHEYFDIVLSYIKQSKILRSQPQPGSIFITSLKSAGYTGRKNLYLIGLDSTSLSNKAVESPILLDTIRTKISDKISFANDNYEYKKYKVRELLTADFENISIGYSNFDTVNIKVQSPSQIYNELKDIMGERKQEKYEEKKRVIQGRDMVKSATSLETLAECPRKFYLKNIMGLSPKEDADIRVDRWLDGKTKGIIVHEVLDSYFNLNEEEQTKEKIVELVEKQCIESARDNVCLLQEVYLREKQNLINACGNIIDIADNDSEWTVLVNELSFGDKRRKNNKIFGVLPKQRIDIMGLELDISGSIDRVDINNIDKNVFRIVDYKTGSMDNFEKRLRFSTGRGKNKDYDYSKTQKLQYYIYKKTLEKILESKKDISLRPEVCKFTYIFEGHEKNGIIDLDFSEEFINVIENRIKTLLDMDILEEQSQVIFDSEGICRYCDYSPICMVDKGLTKVEEEGGYGK
ncbi:PD-(D/E)XK nuclease family protein [Tissierella carlieri]|uniref:PD-(D/E)XK nuclease family protein n=1 Tax=Tissierella carlieri TaxID=689904 RepID=UPI001C103030|nr:PD-(D/E)XK nuclease family protein [Tissierella carlieri]MBU5312392.1 PD-(D/E)XK nuclease family protein [Tissierella carlieri]